MINFFLLFKRLFGFFSSSQWCFISVLYTKFSNRNLLTKLHSNNKVSYKMDLTISRLFLYLSSQRSESESQRRRSIYQLSWMVCFSIYNMLRIYCARSREHVLSVNEKQKCGCGCKIMFFLMAVWCCKMKLYGFNLS